MSLQPIEELPPKLQEIIKLFQSVQEPKAKYEQLRFYGKNLKPLDRECKTRKNKVEEGCVCQVWVRAYLDMGKNVLFEADSDSDSVLTKGLAALLVQGLILILFSNNGQNQNQNPIGSFGDYVIGPGLDLLLQHLAENDPNRYGTPPVRKEVIEALPTVTIKEPWQCSVCLDDFEIETEAREMPFCRHHLPVDDSKVDSERSRNSDDRRESEKTNSEGNISHEIRVEERDGEGRSGNGRRFSFPWPFNNLFSSSSGSQAGGSHPSSTVSSA
ncbi:unnamed protein product [Dovyalis caffra]|uniref:Fe-S metabolism associated domain-containing protein n=1 Tax=Dovyalis caffra TaxID=77055 RepID=A0AAV1RI68_9ROSI|nr:unnamed protein product [Dovyalis caffra]